MAPAPVYVAHDDRVCSERVLGNQQAMCGLIAMQPLREQASNSRFPEKAGPGLPVIGTSSVARS
jgi:hypothetical protein